MNFGADPAPDGLTTDQVSQASDQFIASSPLFKPKTEYILIGDEPQFGAGAVNLSVLLSPADAASLKTYLTFMPRSQLWGFFMANIWPSIPFSGMIGENEIIPTHPIYGGPAYQRKIFGDMVWAAFIDFFNQANLEYVNKNQLDPWDWEYKKTDAYVMYQDSNTVQALQAKFQAFADIQLALDPQAKKILDQFVTLPKLGDLGMEINRQNAIKEFLKAKDYVTAQAIVDMYKYAKDTIIGDTLTQPIPYDIVDKDGAVVARKT